MPWLSTAAMKERTKFVLEWERRRADAPDEKVNISDLTRKYGISRQTGYEWLGRYRGSDSLHSLADRSSRPLTSPTKLSEEIEILVVRSSAGCRFASTSCRPTTAPSSKRTSTGTSSSSTFATCTSGRGRLV